MKLLDKENLLWAPISRRGYSLRGLGNDKTVTKTNDPSEWGRGGEKRGKACRCQGLLLGDMAFLGSSFLFNNSTSLQGKWGFVSLNFQAQWKIIFWYIICHWSTLFSVISAQRTLYLRTPPLQNKGKKVPVGQRVNSQWQHTALVIEASPTETAFIKGFI